MNMINGFKIIEKDITASTNDDARALIQQGLAGKTIIVAEQQTHGRGRQQRHWQSEPGNLFCSFIIRPSLQLRDVALYTFAASLAVRAAILHFLPHKNMQVKWPNDVLVDEKKISGILLEVESSSLIIGIGINCAHYPDNALFPATALKSFAIETAPKNVLVILAGQLDHYISLLERNGFAPLREEWLSHAYRRGQIITVRQDQKDISGVLTGLDANGALILQTAEGSATVTSGDLHAACD